MAIKPVSIEAFQIGKDVWWDNEKHIFRKKRLNLEKVPLMFRCPLCGGVVVPRRERHPRKREITDRWEIQRYNKKVLDVYFERDKPSMGEFSAWFNRIHTEHEDEFKKNVYVEYFEEPLTLSLNKAFFGIYACSKCVKNRPERHAIDAEYMTNTGKEDPT